METSEEHARLTRTFCTPDHARGCNPGQQMDAPGRNDCPRGRHGNFIGRYPGAPARRPQPDAGLASRHRARCGQGEWILGVLLGIACVARLHRNKRRLPFALEVVAFADEEGARLPDCHFRQPVAAGKIDLADLHRKDAAGISMERALRSYGGQPARLKQARFKAGKLLGYLEAHIGARPVLTRGRSEM